jgi:hypothetical protein
VGENLVGVKISVGRFVGGRFVKAPGKGGISDDRQSSGRINKYCSYISNEDSFTITATE